MSTWDTLDNAKKYEGMVNLVVQTTSVGMSETLGQNPVPDFEFTGKEYVYDLIYKPDHTTFLQKAAASGCNTYNGKRMLLEQGKLQFEAFTGYHYPHWIKPEL
jgi:3-dehydroquinate dehydratase/shikimate dehydrogenase